MGITNAVMKRIIIALLVIIGLVITYIYFSQIFPIILAFIIALTFEPFIRFLQRRFKWKQRIFPVLITFLTFLISCGLLIYIAIVVIFDIVYDWAFQIPRYAIEIQLFIERSIASFN